MDLREGVIIRTHGGHYYVQSDGQVTDCTIRGRLKKERPKADVAAIGDRVYWSETEEGFGVIEEVQPRKSVLARTPPPPRAAIAQVIVANPDQVLIVFAARNPPLNPLMLDRYLVAIEEAELPAVIVINKADLIEDEEDLEIPQMYAGIGYHVLFTSTMTGMGIEELHALLQNKLSVLTGPSGVGKSSLLNALWPGLDLRVGEISEVHDRGRHTTAVARLLNPEENTLVADTPGLRQFRFWDIDPEQLDYFFPEMRPFLGDCRFQPCTHMHEPDCAVQAAVERGDIPDLRYESYRRMFEHGF